MDKQKEPSIADIQQEIDIMKEENDETKTQLMKLKKKMEEDNLPAMKKRRTEEEGLPKGVVEKLQLLEDGKLQPSSATWAILRMKNWLPCITTLLSMQPFEELEEDSRCAIADLRQCNMSIIRNSLPTNVGYSTLLCGNMVAHIVSELNKKERLYRLEIIPVFEEERDARTTKQFDYSIFKIYNKCTYIMVEVKLEVPNILTSATKDNLAQLFLEAIYCQSNEGQGEMMCVLTNGFVWHCIVTEFSNKPLKFLKYFKIHIDTNYKDAERICDTLTNYVPTACSKNS